MTCSELPSNMRDFKRLAEYLRRSAQRGARMTWPLSAREEGLTVRKLDHGQGLVEIVRRRNRIDFDPFPWESRVGN
jgi:hypothetical protein